VAARPPGRGPQLCVLHVGRRTHSNQVGTRRVQSQVETEGGGRRQQLLNGEGQPGGVVPEPAQARLRRAGAVVVRTPESESNADGGRVDKPEPQRRQWAEVQPDTARLEHRRDQLQVLQHIRCHTTARYSANGSAVQCGGLMGEHVAPEVSMKKHVTTASHAPTSAGDAP
jgi:hypothetical protein